MLLDRDCPYIFTRPDVLSAEECGELIARIERDGPQAAPIKTSAGELMRTDIRNNERVMFDDFDLAKTLVERVHGEIPITIHGRELCGANERFRCYRYRPGTYFAPHADGAFVRNDCERSYYTFMVYLNEEFEGGHTTFFVEPEVSIKPETGMALFFQHPIVHEGSIVTSGVKYVLRTDLMYRAVR